MRNSEFAFYLSLCLCSVIADADLIHKKKGFGSSGKIGQFLFYGIAVTV